MIYKSIGCTLCVWLKGFFWTFCPYYQLLCVSYIIWYLVATSETKDMAYPFGYSIICIDLSKINKMTQLRAVECTLTWVGWFMTHIMLSHELIYTFIYLSNRIHQLNIFSIILNLHLNFMILFQEIRGKCGFKWIL